MISLSELDNISRATEQQEQAQSSIVQKVADGIQQKQQAYDNAVQSVLDNLEQMRERQLIRNRLNTFAQNISGYAGGGGIHIDPSKKGTFTAAASRHGMGVQQFAAHVHAHPENYSPAMRKKANFARNAAKWHHAFGGPLNTYGMGGTLSHQDGMIKSILDRYLTDYRITSAYRGKNNRVGKLGGKSAHAHLLDDGSSAALDIVSSNMNRLRQELANPQLQKELAAAGFGILDETDPATMKRTGATGAHFHVGRGIKGGGFHLNGYGHQPVGVPSVAQPDPRGLIRDDSFEPISIPASQETFFNPWWSANENDDDFMAQQYAMAAGVGNNLIADAPAWFSDGGLLAPIHPYDKGGLVVDQTRGDLGDGKTQQELITERMKRSIANKYVYNNYEDAIDSPITAPITAPLTRIASNMEIFGRHVPAGGSNCTLNATQWVNPRLPIMSARTIEGNPNRYGYVEVPETHAVPGDLVIADDNKGSYHTMLLSGFSPKDDMLTLNDKIYPVSLGAPLVTYSKGRYGPENLVFNAPLAGYLDQSNGKHDVHYYRHPYEYGFEGLIPELVVTPNGAAFNHSGPINEIMYLLYPNR